MHRIDAEGNVAGQFTEGDPGQAIPATVLDADWANAVQEELAGFIEYMGLTLAKGTNTQLRQAVLALFARLNTWTAKQTFGAGADVSAGDLALVQAALQKVVKSGGKLQVGTSDANDVEILRAGSAVLALTSTALDVKNRVMQGVKTLLLDNGGGTSSNTDGAIWYEPIGADLRARLGGATEVLATQAYADAKAKYTWCDLGPYWFIALQTQLTVGLPVGVSMVDTNYSVIANPAELSGAPPAGASRIKLIDQKTATSFRVTLETAPTTGTGIRWEFAVVR